VELDGITDALGSADRQYPPVATHRDGAVVDEARVGKVQARERPDADDAREGGHLGGVLDEQRHAVGRSTGESVGIHGHEHLC